MATAAALRARVRTRLEESTPAVWTDDELDECLTGALEACSWLFPREAIAAVVVSDGATTILIPEGALDIRRLTLANGAAVPRRGSPTGASTSEQQSWEVFAGSIYLSRPLEAQSVTIWHTAAQTFDSLPPADEGLVVLGALMQALESRAIQDAKRGSLGLAMDDSLITRARDSFERALHRRARRIRATLVHAP
jgi:hypothetical protein